MIREAFALSPFLRKIRKTRLSDIFVNPDACWNTHIRVVTRIAPSLRDASHKGKGESK